MNKEREVLLYLEGYIEAIYLAISPDKTLVITKDIANDLLTVIKDGLAREENTEGGRR